MSEATSEAVSVMVSPVSEGMGSFLARGTSPERPRSAGEEGREEPTLRDRSGRPRSVTSTGAPFHLSTNQVPNSADHLPIRGAGLSADCFKNALCLGLDRRCCWQLLPRDRESVILPTDCLPTWWPHAGTFRRPYAPRCEDGYFVQRAADCQVCKTAQAPGLSSAQVDNMQDVSRRHVVGRCNPTRGEQRPDCSGDVGCEEALAAD
jgi:hypothetical protein